MDIDPYQVEETALNQAKARDTRQKPQEPFLNAPRPSTQFTIHPTIRRSEMQKLIKFRSDMPTLSIYLDLTANHLRPEKSTATTLFHSLRHNALEAQTDYLATLSREQRQQLDQDFQDVEGYLEHDFDQHGVSYMAIFKCGNQLADAFHLTVGGRDDLMIDETPYTLPLEALLHVERPLIVILVVQDQARFTLYRLGKLRELATIDSPEDVGSPQATRVQPVQRRNKTINNRFLKMVADRAQELYGQYKVDGFVLTGSQRLTTELERHLNQREQIFATLPDKKWRSSEELLAAIRTILEDHAAAEEQHLVKELVDNRQSGIIRGLDEVLPAQNRGLIRTLFLDQNLKASGYVCMTDHYLAKQPGTCPTCDKPLTRVDNLVDSLTDWSHLLKVDLQIFTQTPAMQPYGGIAAAMYNL